MRYVRAFTLVELLVVISIISILASILFSSLNSARTAALDSKYFQESISLAHALTSYYLTHGSYPGSVYADDRNGGSNLDTALAPLIAEKFISIIPHYPGWPLSSLDSNSDQIYTQYFPPVLDVTAPATAREYICGGPYDGPTKAHQFANMTAAQIFASGKLQGAIALSAGNKHNLPGSKSLTQCSYVPNSPAVGDPIGQCVTNVGQACIQL